MNRKSIIAAGLVVILAVIGVLVHRVAFAKEETAYRFATVERGDIKSTVSATGTLSAVTTVSVGTQVSGQVSELFVDFNDEVKKGELLARIDPTLAQQAVTDALANLEKAQAQARQASRDYSRNRELATAGLVARSAYEQTESSADVAQASVKSARVALQRAQQNLAYTNIHAPIDGVVVSRNVDEGQTVAASLSAPELFKIANDLSKMEILAQVSESDIAQIKVDQGVEFTVQALQGQTFKGTVKQVRLQSTTQDNVVNYTVVVAVDNTAGKLLPGMTARANFLTKSAEDVLKVANAALRFKPSAASVTPSGNDRERSPSQNRRGSLSSLGMTRSGVRPTFGRLYVAEAGGKLKAVRVRTGITDGTTTQISGKDLTEGMKVIAGTATAAQADAAGGSPFQSGNAQQQRRGPGGF
jgi:HlyD family secretion protein